MCEAENLTEFLEKTARFILFCIIGQRCILYNCKMQLVKETEEAYYYECKNCGMMSARKKVRTLGPVVQRDDVCFARKKFEFDSRQVQ